MKRNVKDRVWYGMYCTGMTIKAGWSDGMVTENRQIPMDKMDHHFSLLVILGCLNQLP